MNLQRAYTDLRTGSMSFGDFIAFLTAIREQGDAPACYAAAPLCEAPGEQPAAAITRQ